MSDGRVLSKADADGDTIEAIAWWDPTQLPGNPAVRPELLEAIEDVLTALGCEPVEKAGAERHRWVVDGPTSCDVCSDNAAAGYIALTKKFPSGDTAPPAHPHCGCHLTAEGGSHG